MTDKTDHPVVVDDEDDKLDEDGGLVSSEVPTWDGGNYTEPGLKGACLACLRRHLPTSQLETK